MDLRERPRRQFHRHPWETARLKFFRRILTRHNLLRPARRILDVGSGDAWFARRLLEILPPAAGITCWDSGYETVPPSAEPGLSFSREIPQGSFELALLLDVLEHVEDDAAFLGSVLERLDPGGTILVTMPAWRRLVGAHDRALAHYRRYDPADARHLLTQAGLRIQECGGLFHALLAPRGLAVLAERLSKAEHIVTRTLEWRWGRPLSMIAENALALDNALSLTAARRGWDLPGLSWWALCRKRS